MYEYQSILLNVVDGDTVDIKIDLGFRIHREIRLRLADVDTHEIHGVETDSDEYRRGMREKEFVEEWFDEAAVADREWPVLIRSEKTGKYGRYIAEVERRSDGAILNDDLITEFGEEIRFPPRNLQSLHGLGPARNDRLEEMGIATLEDLAGFDPSEIAEIAGVNREMAAQWIVDGNRMLAGTE